VWLLLPIAYVLGTFPSAILIARANGIDISTFGSGNPGASNVTRALGWRKGMWVYVLDAGKGALAAGLGLALDGRPLAYWCGAAAIVGHMFPVFRGFKGGKGVATGSGVLLIVQPILAPLAVGLWWLVSKATGKAALGSVIAVALVPGRTRRAREAGVGVRRGRRALRTDPRQAFRQHRSARPARRALPSPGLTLRARMVA
jgi:acyl phosphate:glycerol-3-phosphate acyltransferase